MDDSHPHYPSLSQRYWQLREQLDAAYTAAVWDSQRIDHIVVKMLSIERALASTPRPSSPPCGDAVRHAAPENIARLSLLGHGDSASVRAPESGDR